MDPKVYVVLGGSSPGVFARPPIMPIIIKCTSVPEANAAAGLQKVFNKLDCQNAEGNPEAFAVALAQSNQISDLFATQGPFYAVYNGKSERAIYVRDFSAVEAQVHDHLFAKHHRFESIKDALAYMVLKGNLAKMKELGLYTSKSDLSTSKSGQSTSAARHTDLEHLKTRMVYSYVRDYTGIIDTIYGKTSSPPEYPLHALGKHAGYYLEAHGYTQDTITGIEGIWSESSNVDEFIDLLAPSGMATTEIRWLWDLIRHDDDCGF
ncbi:hypothetical protein C8R43DRAFT_1169716 [Mycena crocata]|nr:hypothetical protein C8R43DRAFT_965462 [Mycena crocata]KAJ7094917.1 hypothetical protein C8R43DRAFT_1169716 [Mycena crocata]